MNTPIGLFGLSSLAREVWMRLAIISSAWRWPMTRCSSVSASFSTVSISFLTMRPTGMPVQSCTTDGHGLLVDARQDQRPSRPAARAAAPAAPCSSASSGRALGSVSGRRLPAGPAGVATGVASAPSAAVSSGLPVPSTVPTAVAQLGRGARGSCRPAPSRRSQRASSASSRVRLGGQLLARPRLRARAVSTPTAFSRPMISSSVCERLDALAGSRPPRPAPRAG